MEITITEAALIELQQLAIPEGMAIRLDAELSGCCTWNFAVNLLVDEDRRNDTRIVKQDLPFFIDQFTKRYLGEELVLDYDPSTGYTVKSYEDVFVCMVK